MINKIRQLPVYRAEFLEVLLNAVKERGAATLQTKKICLNVEVSIKKFVAQFRAE